MRRLMYSVEFATEGHTLELHIEKDRHGKGILNYRVVTGIRGMSDDCRLTPMGLRSLRDAIGEVEIVAPHALALLGLDFNEQSSGTDMGVYKSAKLRQEEQGA